MTGSYSTADAATLAGQPPQVVLALSSPQKLRLKSKFGQNNNEYPPLRVEFECWHARIGASFLAKKVNALAGA